LAIALLGFLRFRQGAATPFSSDYEDPSQNTESQFNSNISNDYYRQAPFNTNNQSAGVVSAGYQQPTY
jgi:hypothetical protein